MIYSCSAALCTRRYAHPDPHAMTTMLLAGLMPCMDGACVVTCSPSRPPTGYAKVFSRRSIHPVVRVCLCVENIVSRSVPTNRCPVHAIKLRPELVEGVRDSSLLGFFVNAGRWWKGACVAAIDGRSNCFVAKRRRHVPVTSKRAATCHPFDPVQCIATCS